MAVDGSSVALGVLFAVIFVMILSALAWAFYPTPVVAASGKGRNVDRTAVSGAMRRPRARAMNAAPSRPRPARATRRAAPATRNNAAAVNNNTNPKSVAVKNPVSTRVTEAQRMMDRTFKSSDDNKNSVSDERAIRLATLAGEGDKKAQAELSALLQKRRSFVSGRPKKSEESKADLVLSKEEAKRLSQSGTDFDKSFHRSAQETRRIEQDAAELRRMAALNPDKEVDILRAASVSGVPTLNAISNAKRSRRAPKFEIDEEHIRAKFEGKELPPAHIRRLYPNVFPVELELIS